VAPQFPTSTKRHTQRQTFVFSSLFRLRLVPPLFISNFLFLPPISLFLTHSLLSFQLLSSHFWSTPVFVSSSLGKKYLICKRGGLLCDWLYPIDADAGRQMGVDLIRKGQAFWIINKYFGRHLHFERDYASQGVHLDKEEERSATEPAQKVTICVFAHSSRTQHSLRDLASPF
jgi:hypothetical protein